MEKNQRWSEQLLTGQAIKVMENDQEVVKSENTLFICVEGLDLYRNEFMTEKYKGKNWLAAPFDFVVTAGVPCPNGKFYEIEYTIGGTGVVYRGLMQLVDPVSDIRTVLASMARYGLVPEGFTPHKAWLRGDIESVRIGSCSNDENGEAIFYSGRKEAKEAETSISDTTKEPGHACCMEYFGELHPSCYEIWINETDIENYDKIFVCGSSNVNDPEFADIRKADMDELSDHISDVARLVNEYNIPHFVAVEAGSETRVSVACTQEWLDRVIATIIGKVILLD